MKAIHRARPPSVAALPASRETLRAFCHSLPFGSPARDHGFRGNRMFVFGVGFVGRYVCDQLLKQGWQVSGTCTNDAKRRELEQMGLHSFMFDSNQNELRSLHTLEQATHVLVSIPPVLGIGDPLLWLHHEGLQSALSHGNLQWLCYLSSTSVYGDCGGAWVDEDYPVNPTTESARARYAAEEGWLHFGHDIGVPVNIFRLGGIYGPGRSILDTLLKQKSLSKRQKMRNSRLYTARVHVADIYQAINASFAMKSSARIYNVVDDDHAPRGEVFAFTRRLIEEKWPHKAIASQSDYEVDLQVQVQEGKVGGEKRVSNARLKKELGVRLLYPSYRSGLQSIIDSWDNFSQPP